MDAPDETFIRPTAAKLAARYRMVDREDIAQELRIWWMTHAKAVEKYVYAEEKDQKLEAWRLRQKLYRVGDRYCRQVKAEALGYRTEDESFYDKELIRDLLPMIWKPELMLQSNPNEGQQRVRSSKKPAEGNNLPVMVADVSRAYRELSEEDQTLLRLHFDGGYSYTDLTVVYQVNVSAVKMRVQRALKRMVEVLGGESPWVDGPGARRVMSNAEAQAVTSHQMEG